MTAKRTVSKSVSDKVVRERMRLMETYRMLVASVREARSLQGVMEKDAQMRRVMSQLRQTARPQT